MNDGGNRLALGFVEVEANLLHDAAQEGFASLPHRRIIDVLLVVAGIASVNATLCAPAVPLFWTVTV